MQRIIVLYISIRQNRSVKDDGAINAGKEERSREKVLLRTIIVPGLDRSIGKAGYGWDEAQAHLQVKKACFHEVCSSGDIMWRRMGENGLAVHTTDPFVSESLLVACRISHELFLNSFATKIRQFRETCRRLVYDINFIV